MNDSFGGLCHSLGLRFVITTYVTNHYAMKAYVIKVCFNLNLVYYVIRTYATKACVTLVYNITNVIVILV